MSVRLGNMIIATLPRETTGTIGGMQAKMSFEEDITGPTKRWDGVATVAFEDYDPRFCDEMARRNSCYLVSSTGWSITVVVSSVLIDPSNNAVVIEFGTKGRPFS